jgi:hypothetical protein
MTTNNLRGNVPSWVIEFLLFGESKHSSIPGRNSILPFCWRKEFDGCLAASRNWLPLWRKLRDVLLPQWRREHPDSLPWAETHTPDAEEEIRASSDGKLSPLSKAELKIFRQRIKEKTGISLSYREIEKLDNRFN